MITLGVDLSAEPAKTVVASISWTNAGATIESLDHRATDQTIVELARGATKVGIDCPLGWPEAFVDFVARHQRGSVLPGEGRDIAARNRLAFRRTDLAVMANGGPMPLSVSTDRIGRCAMRVAGLLAALSQLSPAGEPLDRTGSGQVVEVYPAAALAHWGFVARGYKGTRNIATRRSTIERFFGETHGWLGVSGAIRSECEQSDDAFDSVVAALNARAAAISGGVRMPVDPEDVRACRTEGWIAVPTCSLAELDPRPAVRSANQDDRLPAPLTHEPAPLTRESAPLTHD